MTTGTWPTLDHSDPANASAATWQHQQALRSAWLRGITKRGKPPRDHYARMMRVLRLMAIGLPLIVSIGWALVGAALLIW